MDYLSEEDVEYINIRVRGGLVKDFGDMCSSSLVIADGSRLVTGVVA